MEYKERMKELVEKNMVLEQKNIVLRKEINDIRMQLAQNKVQLDMYKNYHTKVVEMIERLHDAYSANRVFEIYGILSSLFENNYNVGLTINEIKSIENNYKKVMSATRNENIDLCNFCDNYKKVYVYGAGKKAQRLAGVLDRCGIQFEAFIVSDKETKADSLLSHDIKYLSDILEEKDEIGIIIGLNPTNAREVYPILEKYEINNIYQF